MARRKRDGKKIVNLWRYSFFEVGGLLFGGGVFLAIFFYFIAQLILEIIRNIKMGETFDAFIIVPILIMLLFGFFGAYFFIWGIKDVYHWTRYSITKKRGEECVAEIVGDKYIVKGNGGYVHTAHHETYYSLILSYYRDGEKKSGKTDYIYLDKEYDYLRTLPQVKIKVHKNYVIINEVFRYEIYQ